MKLVKFLGHLSIVLILTVLTQVGGIIWLISLVIAIKFKKKKRYVFLSLYLICNLIIVPPVASLFGRVQLPSFNDNLAPRNWFYPLAFRNYVNPELRDLLLKSSKSSGIQITYLDANFPFLDGFSLLPHLSHNDGKKVDLSFQYTNEDGTKTNKKPSLLGYGTYVSSNNRTSKSCLEKGYWQYDFPKYLAFGLHKDLQFDSKSTRILIKTLSSHSETQKIFIEPYLKQSLRLENETKIRFHGCQAVRHDDHIHLQIK
ncbi:hypothetical protein [Winogradskyella sp.]|uniref:hypothetical protein n=1 Tax=Winogradskyella sp. TaxID=1883156 RepID=UPI002356D948|nr:hypothetical protein [Winogradskyella sp.]